MIRAGDNFYSRHHSPFTDNMLSQLKLSVINRLKSPKSIDYKSIPWPNFSMERGKFLSEAILSNQNHSIEDRAENLINALKEANRIEQIYLPKHNAYIKAISLKSNPKNSIDMRKQLYRFIDGNFNYQSQDLFRGDLSIRDMKVQVMETLNSSKHTSFYNWLVEENFVHDPRALQQINDKRANNSQILRPESWAQIQDLPSEQTIYCSHGGGFFFLSDFLSKDQSGYRLEYEGRGIQVHPRTGPDQFWNISRESREECYSSSSHAYGDYPARLSFEIQGQYLDSAPNCYEAGLRQDFIDHMKNIKLLNIETNETIEAKDYESFIEMINFNSNTQKTLRNINPQALFITEKAIIGKSDIDKQVNQIAEPKYKKITKGAGADLVNDKNLDPEKILENKDEIIKQLDKFAELDIDLNGQDSTVSPEIKEEFIALLDTSLELIAKGQDSALKKLNDQDQSMEINGKTLYPFKANKANVLIDTIFLLTGLNKYPDAEKQASHNDRVVPILMRVASQL